MAHGQRFGVVAAVGALLMFATLGAVPQLAGDDGAAANAATAGEVKPTFDVDAVVEEASHAIAAVPGEPGTFAVSDPGYRATFDTDGFAYTPVGSNTPFAVDVAAVERGGVPLAIETGGWRAKSNVAARPLGAEVREQVTARAGEVEWDVVLTAPPAGAGDLVVRAGLTGTVGEPAVAGDGAAWRLTLTDGTPVELGETVIVDATGAEVHRALPTIVDGHIELVAPHAVLEGAVYPLTIDPTVSGPTPITSSSVDPSVAFDGTDFLVVYTCTICGSPQRNEIFGAQVSADGTNVQPIGAISTINDDRNDRFADVTWNGSNYLVVWQHEFFQTDQDIQGRIVTAAGFASGGVLTISGNSFVQSVPKVAASGSTYYVVWQDSSTGNGDIYGGRVTTAGVRLDGEGRAATSDTAAEFDPDVAWNGANFLVAYTRVGAGNDIYARRVSSSAAPVGSAAIVSNLGSEQFDSAVASDGSGYLVVWTDTRNGSASDVYGSRVNAAGARLDANGIAVSTATGVQDRPVLAYNGNYLVAWQDKRRGFSEPDAYASRVASTGSVQDPSGFLIAEFTFALAVGSAPGNDRWAVEIGENDQLTHRIASK